MVVDDGFHGVPSAPSDDSESDLGEDEEDNTSGFILDQYLLKWIDRAIAELRERLLEDAAIGSGEFGASHASTAEATDSGCTCTLYSRCLLSLPPPTSPPRLPAPPAPQLMW